MKNPKSADWRPQFTLDLRKANPAQFFALVDSFGEWTKNQPEPDMEMLDGWYSITPEMAEKMLLRNVVGANRKASIATIVYYAEQMIAGDWQPTGQPLIFSINGTLLDGQHRLWAGYLSGTTFETYIVKLPHDIPGVFAYIDNAKTRTLKDALYTAGYDGLAGVMSLVVNMAWYYENNAYTASEKRKVSRVAPKRGLDYVASRPNIVQGVRLIAGEHASAASVIGHKDVAAFTASKILDLHDEAVLDEFFDLVASEPDTAEASAIVALQEVLEIDRGKKDQMKKHQVLGYVIHAFNNWVQQKPVKKLKLDVAEPFPQFVGSAFAQAAE